MRRFRFTVFRDKGGEPMTWKRLANRLALASVFGWCAACSLDVGLAALQPTLARWIAARLLALAGLGVAVAVLVALAFFWSAVDK